jgi:hypothetical protein
VVASPDTIITQAQGPINLGAFGKQGLTKWSAQAFPDWETIWTPKAYIQVDNAHTTYSPYLGNVGHVQSPDYNLADIYSNRLAKDRPYTVPAPDSAHTLPQKVFNALLHDHNKVQKVQDQESTEVNTQL